MIEYGWIKVALRSASILFILVLLAACANSPPPSLELKRCYESSRQSPDAAVEDCTRAIDSGKLTPVQLSLAHIFRGNGWENKQEYDRAFADYDEAVRLDPNSSSALGGRGNLHRIKGDLTAAIDDFNAAIHLDPRRASNYANRATAWYAKGDLGKASADYDEALRRDSNDFGAYMLRGFYRYDTGDFKGAVDDLGVVAPRYSGHAALYLYLAKKRVGQDGTSELASEAVPMKNVPWASALADLYLGRQTPDAVLALTEPSVSAAKAAEDHCNVQYYVAEWQLLHGDRSDAAANLARVVDGCPHGLIVYRGAKAEVARLGQSH